VYKIIIRERGRELREVPLHKPRFFFGRDLSNEVPLADDSVSSHHFSIETRQDKIILRDEGSLNGTFLGNSRERVKTAELKHGDIYASATPSSSWSKSRAPFGPPKST